MYLWFLYFNPGQFLQGKGRTQMLRMGLMRYVAKTPIFEEVQIRHIGRSVPGEVIDKWNYDFYPSIEYDLFPYSQSTRRQLRLLYGIGYSYNKYADTTIYNKVEESLYGQTLMNPFF